MSVISGTITISSYTSTYTVNNLAFAPQVVSLYSKSGVDMHYYKSTNACRESTGPGGSDTQLANKDAMTITRDGFKFYPHKSNGDNWWQDSIAAFVAYKDISPFG